MGRRFIAPRRSLWDSGWKFADYAAAATSVLITIGLSFLLHRLMPHANLSLLFLTAVLVVAARMGLGPSLLASVLSFLAYNYFFTRPYYTLNVADEGDVATLLFFLVMAALGANLGARMRREIDRRKASLHRMSALYEFSRQMASATRAAAIPEQLAQCLYDSLDRPASVFMANASDQPDLRAAAGEAPELSTTVAERAWATRTNDEFTSRPWTFFRLGTADRKAGMAALFGPLDAELTDAARGLCEQAGTAMDRTRLAEDLEETRMEYETEQLRSALLSSVSHDLRTPLASIIGAATSLLEYGEAFSPGDRRELLLTVVEESQRLDRHIQNLLDMTRIGRGGLTLRRDWVDLRDIVSGALNRLQDAARGVAVVPRLPASLPLLWVHGALLEQALVNLLDNAIRFSPPGGTIAVEAFAGSGAIVIEVRDQGPGIPENERELIFDMFYTARQGDRGRQQGTGLGLAICRGMVGAHGGTVEALPGPDGRGTRMRVTLPLVQERGERPA